MKEAIRKLWYEAGAGQLSVQQEEIIERFAELVVEKCADTVIESDPSPKAILHEPYRTIMNNVMESLDDDKDT